MISFKTLRTGAHASALAMLCRALLFLIAGFLSVPAFSQTPSVPEKERGNFMVVVRESVGVQRTEDALKPIGKTKARLADGKDIEIEAAWWEFIGDTHIRFVFDGPNFMANASPAELEKLGIKSVEEALALALENIRRVYGEPKSSPVAAGIYSVAGRSADLNSSYFLDRPYWIGLLKSHPEGLVVGVPMRGGLLYAPLSNDAAVERLRRGIARLHADSDRLRVSSGLFLFKDGRWSIFQAPVPASGQ